MRPAALTPEEDEVEQALFESDHVCCYCKRDIHLLDELILLQVMRPYVLQTHEGCFLAYAPVEDDDGYYAYSPYFFCLECFEELVNDHLDTDEPVPHPHGVATCSACHSSILEHETSGIASFGEFRRSPRSPNGEPAIYFEHVGRKPELLCIHCLATLNEDSFEMWEELSHDGECVRGRKERCWRTGECQQGCKRKR